MPQNINQCIYSWKKHLPLFTFKLWNEENSPIDHPFVKKALKFKKYAFAADYVRLHALNKEGGIYLDTDMLILKGIEELLEWDFFIGEEVKGRLSFGIIGALPSSPIIQNFMQYYNSISFDPGAPPIITFSLTDHFNKIYKNNIENLNIRIYSPEYFYPLPFEKKNQDYRRHTNKKTIAVHLWNHSWKSEVASIADREYFKALKQCITTIRLDKSKRTNRHYYKSLVKACINSFIK